MSSFNTSKFGIVTKVSGPLIVAKNMNDVHVYDVVRIGEKGLIGEIIELRDDFASIQVYEETSGIGPGDKVYLTNEPLSVWLAPGLIEGIFDGIERPLDSIYSQNGEYIPSGIDVPRLDTSKKWTFKSKVKVGDYITGGVILGEVDETASVVHKVMLKPDLKGTVTYIFDGDCTIVDTICRIVNDNNEEIEVSMLQKWPVRKKRPFISKLPPNKPMLTGVRIIDTLFPIAQGGIACVPGPFGSGKTVVQHQLAKYSDSDIIVYIGCGERGNEMADVLLEFPELIDPKTNNSLMTRTILIANTSNMPVAAREASIYTGITIGEYYRDMGYKVAIMADSTSRWAEALREMSGRLEEMPGEEGYPAYLSSRLAEFYERAGMVKCLGNQNTGAISVIGAVSPPGGDTSEPVSQATLRIVKVFWGLSSSLAYKRHFPAIDWLRSYSLYSDTIFEYIQENVGENWIRNVTLMMDLLQEEASLLEIVRLVGVDALSYNDRAKLLMAQIIKEDFLHQNAFHEVDAKTSIEKIYLMTNIIYDFYENLKNAIKDNKRYNDLETLPVREKIGRFKYVYEKDINIEYQQILNDIKEQFDKVVSEE